MQRYEVFLITTAVGCVKIIKLVQKWLKGVVRCPWNGYKQEILSNC